MDAFEAHARLRQAIRDGRPTLGLFVKIPAMQIVECLKGAGLDFVVLDAEHAAFGAAELDRCILAGRSIGLPVLVRPRDANPAAILQALDLGAAGIVAPHVSNVERAREIVAAARYEGGSRGFSGASRAAAYGAIPAAEFRRLSDRATLVIGQLEDRAGVEDAAAISALDALDAVLIGRADLAVSLGAASLHDAAVEQAVDRVLNACNKNGKSVGVYLPSHEEVAAFRSKGATVFILSTDQALLVEAASSLAKRFKDLAK